MLYAPGFALWGRKVSWNRAKKTAREHRSILKDFPDGINGAVTPEQYKEWCGMSTAVVIMGACGRMGRTIAELAKSDAAFTLAGMVERGECVGQLQGEACPTGTRVEDILPQAPGAVVVDFTAPEASLHTAREAARLGNSVVIGTTGFNDVQKAELAELAVTIPLFWAPNMSIGVNVLLKILPQLVRLLGEKYDLDIMEIHHNKKKDAPSGTALRLAECLAEARDWNPSEVECCARHGIIGARPKEEIGIQSLRGGDVVGVHTVYCMGPGERIEVTHQAHSRETFAQGALRAAQWLATQKAGRLYSMSDML